MCRTRHKLTADGPLLGTWRRISRWQRGTEPRTGPSAPVSAGASCPRQELVLNAGGYVKGASSPQTSERQGEGQARGRGGQPWLSGLRSPVTGTEEGRSQQVGAEQSNRCGGERHEPHGSSCPAAPGRTGSGMAARREDAPSGLSRRSLQDVPGHPLALGASGLGPSELQPRPAALGRPCPTCTSPTEAVVPHSLSGAVHAK